MTAGAEPAASLSGLPPDVAGLAAALSAAARIEPELIRAIRLLTVPSAGVDAETELWFSDLVATRSPDAIVLRPELTGLLRERLAAMLADATQEHPVRQIGRIMRWVHAGIPPALRLEEEVTWAALSDPDDSSLAAGLLVPVLRSLVEEEQAGLADWFSRAWPRLPESVRSTRTAWQIAQVAARILPDAAELRSGPVPEGLVMADAAELVRALPDVPLGVGLSAGEIVLGEASGRLAIPVPDTNPRLLEVIRTGADPRPVAVPEGEIVRVPVDEGRVLVRNARGAVFDLTRASTSVASRRLRPLGRFTRLRRRSGFDQRYRQALISGDFRLADHSAVLLLGFDPREFGEVYTDLVLVRPDGRRSYLGDILGHPRGSTVMIIGAPGSGKTSLLRHTARVMCSPYSRLRASGQVPILLYLRDCARAITAEPGVSLGDLVTSSTRSHYGLAVPAGWFETRLRAADCVVMLDGLDEVSGEDDRRAVSAWIDAQAVRYPGNDFVVTSRPARYRSTPLEYADTLLVQPLTPEQVNEFVQRWYLAEDRRGAGPDDLLARIDQTSALRDLAANPLLLTMMVTVQYVHGTLPELYGQICSELLWRRQMAKNLPTETPSEELERLMKALAFEMMGRRVRRLSTGEAVAILRAASKLDAEAVLRQAEYGGLLVEPEPGLYEFVHLAFQEYLAAVHIRAEELLSVLTDAVADSWWQNTTLLYVSGADASPIVAACIADGSAQALRLAQECAWEAAELDPGLREQLAGDAPGAFHGRRAELDSVLHQLMNPGERAWLIVGPPGIGKTWFVLEVANAMAGRLPNWTVSYVDLREEAPGVLPSIEVTLGRLLLSGPEASPGRVASEMISGGQRRLFLLDSAELLDEPASRALRAQLSQVHQLVQEAGQAGTDFAFIVASRYEYGWRGLVPAPRLRSLPLAEVSTEEVFVALAAMAERQRSFRERSGLRQIAVNVHRLSEGFPGLLTLCLRWIEDQRWIDLGRLETPRIFREIAGPFIEDLLSRRNLMPAGTDYGYEASAAVRSAIEVLARYRLFTRSHLSHHLDTDPELARAADAAQWLYEDLWEAIADSALLARPLDEPWLAIQSAIRRLLFRYDYESDERRVDVHREARAFTQTWAGQQSGTEQVIGLVEVLWHETELLRFSHAEHMEQRLTAFARDLFSQLEPSSAFTEEELRAFAAARISDDVELASHRALIEAITRGGGLSGAGSRSSR
jgi:energy-coupling factor transporter ATP-binding protein EcfA2